jgi:HK97 family phage major capsid protein
MSEQNEINTVIKGIKDAFDEFRDSNEKRVALLEKGRDDTLLNEKVEGLNGKLVELEKAKDELEKKLARKNVDKKFDEIDVDKKAFDFSNMVSRKTGRMVQVNAEQYTAYEKALAKALMGGTEQLTSDEHKALSVGSDPDGGFLVTPDTNGRIVAKMFETSPMRQVASAQTINSDALEGLYDLDEAAAGWVGETSGRPTTNTPQLGKWRIDTHEQYANPAATQKMLDDSSLNIEAWLSNKVSDKFSRQENAAFVNGDGISKPRGFLTYPSGTTLPGTLERSITGVNGNFAAAGAGADVILDVIGSLKGGYRNGATFAMNRSVTTAVRKLKTADGDYLWQPSLALGQPSTLAGYPVIGFEDMPDLATDSLSIAFGNFAAGYQIVDRLGVRVLRDPYTNKPYVHFYTVKRVGGDVIDFDAIKLIEFTA